MGYEILLKKADKLGLIVKEADLKTKDGFCKGNRIAISKRLTTSTEKRCVLAEEIGHYKTTTGNITDQTKIENRKQELKARRYGHKLLIEPVDFVHAFKSGITNRYELAEFLDITEEVLEEIISNFKMKYGIGHIIDNYYLKLEPYFGIVKLFE